VTDCLTETTPVEFRCCRPDPLPRSRLLVQSLGPRTVRTRRIVEDRKVGVQNRANGGESVSQSPLKDKALSTFLDQNPPFELRRKPAFRFQSFHEIHRGSSKYWPNPSISVAVDSRVGWRLPSEGKVTRSNRVGRATSEYAIAAKCRLSHALSKKDQLNRTLRMEFREWRGVLICNYGGTNFSVCSGARLWFARLQQTRSRARCR